MADYSASNRRPVPPRNPGYDNGPGASSNYQRDAAFSNIFGAAPPPGRSQTMTSMVAPPDMNPQQQQHRQHHHQQQHPHPHPHPHPQQRPPPPPQQQQQQYHQQQASYDSERTASMRQAPLPPRRPPGGGYNRGYGPDPMMSQRTRTMDASTMQGMAGGPNGGYFPRGGLRSVSGGPPMPSPQAQYLQQQQQMRRFPGQGPPPPRPDPRASAPLPPPSQQHQQQQQQQQQAGMGGGRGPGGLGSPGSPEAQSGQDGYANVRTPSQRFFQGSGGPGPSLNSDPYRSQSFASMPRPNGQAAMYHPPPNTYQAPANATRFAQYAGGTNGVPGNYTQSRTTAQGRVVPDRHHEDRTMSMTGGYASHSDHRDAHQTMSGRIIPNRRMPGGGGINGIDGGPNGHPNIPVVPGTQTRTTSMASTTSTALGSVAEHQRTMSMASTVAPSVAASDRTEVPSSSQQLVSNRGSLTRSIDGERPPTAKIRPPLVYPALLSRVAEVFREKIVIGDRTKNELSYKNAFSGAEAVDVLSFIIRTTDRNLALLLGRALDAQKFFHDVTYEHRLRDSTNEMYQFRENLDDMGNEDTAPLAGTTTGVNGVFVLLSECYSPTCTRDQLCYSIACPRRLEQVSRLNLKMGPGLQGTEGTGAMVGEDDADVTDEQKLWINSVPKEVADSISDHEKKRQEVISEICYTERDFVKDLDYLRDFWILPLRAPNSPIPAARRMRVVNTIFSNIIDPPAIRAVSARFAKALTERQQKNPIVNNVGDIFQEFAPQFEPFIRYGSRQLEAKYEFENERANNPAFSRFVDEIERRRESRKLELNGYLTKPTTRLARYPLLLENVLKYTEKDSPDQTDIPQVLVIIRDLLSRVNAESGKAENRFNLRRLDESLEFRPNERVDLKLREASRELVFKSQLKKSPADPPDIVAYLLDHAVLLVRTKQVNKVEKLKAYRRPIPLELLSIKEMDEVIPPNGAVKRSSSSLLPLRNNNSDAKKGEGWPITFRHLGKAGYELTLYASNQAARQKWLEYIDTAQKRLRARADFLNITIIPTKFTTAVNKINCAAPFDGGRKLIYGTDNGIYVADRKARDSTMPRRVVETQAVTQVDVLEEYQLLLVLSNRTLLSFPLAALDPNEPLLAKRPKKIQSHCTFFKTGICLGRHLVCCVKSSALSTTVKVYEPNDAMSKAKNKKGFGKMFNAGQDELKPFKEFYIPTESTSIHFLKSSLCVASARGFEVVSLMTLETQSLLDQADTSLDFVARKENVRPIHIERLNGEFLLNYSEFSFFVNRNGWRARPEWRIDWEGSPQSFALSYPWILAFEPNFIELRHIENGAVHIVPHKNIRMLHCSTHEIIFAYEDERGEDVVEALDFWKSQRKSEMPAPPDPADNRGGGGSQARLSQ
ncbi:Rho guanyl nucleotide exchange factor [Niveomyces insectorum RCEF 264]|uniref:Rho guanyl nucleotide exchange factor n=1 Tax=Niveomyces insectorum RCEF 264 TaxID=1081102 RepID=A0A162I7X4_9HYPO|nr:Rho guanyl nucleotide exchange factor [Niveomyces insectorum RCEF 264]